MDDTTNIRLVHDDGAHYLAVSCAFLTGQGRDSLINLAQLTHIHILTLLFPSKLERGLIIGMLG